MERAEALELLSAHGFTDESALEQHVIKLQNAAGGGTPLVDDATYDGFIRILKALIPDSPVLNRNWETANEQLDAHDAMLEKYGMCSINTVASIDDLGYFEDVLTKAIELNISHDSLDIHENQTVDMIASLKDNGHGIRVVYENGELIRATTRGRYKKGRDITRHAKAVLPHHVSRWDNISLLEIRGEMLVSIENFEKFMQGKAKTPLSSVTSLIRDSVTDEELKLLSIECYKILVDEDELYLPSLKSEFEELDAAGIPTPPYLFIPGVELDTYDEVFDRVLGRFESFMDRGLIKNSCDGIVFAINDNNIFYNLGKNGNTYLGNFALKSGRYWEQNVYSSTIEQVQFIHGKVYLTPKAIIRPVVTANGSEVRNVPLYNVGVIERYGLVPGSTIFFRYGGEQGVTLCDNLGNSVKV